MTIVVIGRGKVGSALARALRRRRVAVRLVRGRGPLTAAAGAELVVLAVPGRALRGVVRRLRAAAKDNRRWQDTAVVHTAGSLGPDLLRPLAPFVAGVGQAHPVLSFSSTKSPPSLAGAQLTIVGSPVAVERARRLATLLGMTPRVCSALNVMLYHAGTALAANGAVALAAGALAALKAAGVSSPERALAPLLASVVENVKRLGVPEALSGPVRRGEVRTVGLHVGALWRLDPPLADLYAACVRGQIPLALELGEAGKADLRAIESLMLMRIRAGLVEIYALDEQRAARQTALRATRRSRLNRRKKR